MDPGLTMFGLHSICSGRQSFHILILDSLAVGVGGSGEIDVPSSYFGRGLCVIVYANVSLTRVLATRTI